MNRSKPLAVWLFVCLLFGLQVATGQVTCADGVGGAVIWENAGPLTTNQCREYEQRAWASLGRIVKGAHSVTNSRAFYNDYRGLPQWRMTPSVDFHFEGSNIDCNVSFFPQGNDNLRYYLDILARDEMQRSGEARVAEANRIWRSERPDQHTGEFHTYIRKVHTADQAVSEAEQVVRTVGGLDPATFRLFSCFWHQGGWEVWFHARVRQYAAPEWQVQVLLGDNGKLDLVRYQSTVYRWPQPQNVEVRIGQAKARELADLYLEKYCGSHEVSTLQFATNRLEVLRPNYFFTKDSVGVIGLTNAPTLTWVNVYERKRNTLTRTPVEILVDAGDGAMLGGCE